MAVGYAPPPTLQAHPAPLPVLRALEDSNATHSGLLLAPYVVTTGAGMFTEVSPSRWRIKAGTAVSSFMGANGPSEVSRYNWVKTRLDVDTILVTVVPVEPAGAKQARRDTADMLQLTTLGAMRAATPALASKRVYLMEFACTGRAHGVAKESSTRPTARAPAAAVWVPATLTAREVTDATAHARHACASRRPSSWPPRLTVEAQEKDAACTAPVDVAFPSYIP